MLVIFPVRSSHYLRQILNQKCISQHYSHIFLTNQVDLIFGCASFPSCNYKLFENQLSYLSHFHRPPYFLDTTPIDELRADFKITKKEVLNSEEEFRKLPPLIKAYIRVGAWVGTGAIVDSKFNTTDVLIILNSKKILKRYAQLSFQKLE